MGHFESPLSQFCIRFLVFQLAFSVPFNVIAQDNSRADNEQEMHVSLKLNEADMISSIVQLHEVALKNNFNDLPEAFKVCYELIQMEYPVTKEQLIPGLHSFVLWLRDKVEQGHFNNEPHDVAVHGITRGGGNCCCNTTKMLNQILNLLIQIAGSGSSSCKGIGSPGDTPCQETIFGILGDPCVTLSGQSIAQALATIETELSTIASLTTLESIAIELNNTVTTLEAITIELNATVTSLQSSINGTFTALNACCNSTFSVLGNVGIILGRGSSISGTLLNILQNTNTLTNCCAGTFSVLGDVGAILGRGASISGTLATLITDFNNTWTILGCSASVINTTTIIGIPGIYCLGQDLNFASGNAITIASSDVSLNLNQRTINGTGGGVNGVVINSGLNNIAVQNGTIRNVTNNGVLVNNGATNVALNGLSILSTGGTGINFAGSAPITNCLTTNCEIIGTITGIYLNDCQNNTFKNCIISNVVPVGVRLLGGQNNTFESCTIENISTLDTSETSILAGFWIGTTEQATNINNCIVTSSTVVGSGHPYGILMDELPASGTLTDIINTTTNVAITNMSWTPDGNFLAISSDAATADQNIIQVYSFTSTPKTTLTFVAGVNTGSAEGDSVSWSPGGQYLAAMISQVLHIYQFNGVSLLEVTSQPFASDFVTWSPNGRFLAGAGGGAGNQVTIFQFTGLSLQIVATIATTNDPVSCAWSPDSNYVAVTDAEVGPGARLEVYSFNGFALTLAASVTSVANDSSVNPAWSPDGRFIAWGDDVNFYVYEFTGSALILRATASPGVNPVNRSVAWSADGNFMLAAGVIVGLGANAVFYKFNRNPFSLTVQAIHAAGGTPAGTSVLWNPNAQYAAIASSDESTTGLLSIVQTFVFPNNCVINNNQISNIKGQPLSATAGVGRGVGIDGSSATNLFTANTLFNNDVNTEGIAAPAIFSAPDFNASLALNEQFTWSVLGDVGAILGTGATISGTLLSIYDAIQINNCDAIYIHQSDVGATGYVITAPGVYKLAEDIVFSPAAPANAITIDVSGVVVDLQCFSITQGNGQTGVNGIVLSASNRSNIVVENGQLEAFTNKGIIFTSDQDITIRNVQFIDVQVRAISLEMGIGAPFGCVATFIENCFFFGCGSSTTSDAVLFGEGPFQLQINNSTFYNNQGGTGLFNIWVDEGVNIECNAIVSQNNSSANGAFTTYNFTGCSNVTLNNCESNGDFSEGGVFTGISGSGGNGFLIKGCTIANTSADGNGVGIEFDSTSSSVIKKCRIFDNQATGGATNTYAGMVINGGSSNTLVDCIVDSNFSLSDTTGIELIGGAINNTIVRCIASLNSSTNAIGQGLFIQSSNNNLVQDSEFSRNVGVNNASSFGINYASGISNIFSRCRAMFNGSSAANQLNGIPAGSTVALTSSTMNNAAGPWGNAGVIP